MDAITLLIEDHRRIDLLLDAVIHGDLTAVPRVCEALLLHSRMEEEVLYPTSARLLDDGGWDASAAIEDHAIMKRLIAELSEEPITTPSYVDRVGVLVRLWRDHVREEEEILFPQLAAALDPRAAEEVGDALAHVGRQPPTGTAEAQQDPGASSDGDVSWVESPVTQNPRVDRSVAAVIQRTQGM